MEILYVIGMIAVFVLCLTLLSTARRILRATPLSITEGSARTYDLQQPNDDALTESSARLLFPTIETAPLEINSAAALVLDEPLVLEAATTQATVPEMIAAIEPAPSATNVRPEELAEEEIAESPRTGMWSRFPKPTRQTYNYALECVLIGVSAWVLIQTQRDALRQRSAQPSHGRVA